MSEERAFRSRKRLSGSSGLSVPPKSVLNTRFFRATAFRLLLMQLAANLQERRESHPELQDGPRCPADSHRLMIAGGAWDRKLPSGRDALGSLLREVALPLAADTGTREKPQRSSRLLGRCDVVMGHLRVRVVWNLSPDPRARPPVHSSHSDALSKIHCGTQKQQPFLKAPRD